MFCVKNDYIQVEMAFFCCFLKVKGAFKKFIRNVKMAFMLVPPLYLSRIV